MELAQLTLQQAREFVRRDTTKRDELIDALEKRVKKIDPKIKAYVHFDPKRIARDLKSNGTGALFGIPISIKDNMTTNGWETTCASKILNGFVPPYDATAVRKLRESGAVIFGKCNMDEFAFGSSCETSSFFVTRNPWNLDCVPGGSSGGSAAAVSSEIAIAALGSDTGGSIRQPASFCGVVGLKPTYGRVSRYGLIAFGSSLDQIGPVTKTVEDNAILLGVIAGHDDRDSTSAEAHLVTLYAA